MITIEEARTRVAAGAKVLDTVKPGWASKVDVGILCMSHSFSCVLAQVYERGFAMAVEMLSLDLSRPLSMYLDAWGFHDDTGFNNYPQLQNAWIEAIAARQSWPEAAVQPVRELVGQ